MIHFAATMPPPTSRIPPKRSDSLAQARAQSPAPFDKDSQDAVLQAVQDDIRDAKRILTHGQEEDLRAALSKMMSRVTELSDLLKASQKTLVETENSLNVAQSNLKLVIANNEMLEEAVSRSATRDVGWRRSGIRTDSVDSATATASGATSPTLSNAATLPGIKTSPTSPVHSPVITPQQPPQQQPTQDGRFFRFRFSNSSTSSVASATATPTTSSKTPGGPLHLTSSSMPTLPSEREVELEKRREELDQKKAELEKLLEEERKGRQEALKQKEDLEAELESLSQALFEEANKMVAQERMKLADTEEELREARQEKDALKSALRLIEAENHRLRDHDPAQTDGPAIREPETRPPEAVTPKPSNSQSLPEEDEPSSNPDPQSKKQVDDALSALPEEDAPALSDHEIDTPAQAKVESRSPSSSIDLPSPSISPEAVKISTTTPTPPLGKHFSSILSPPPAESSPWSSGS